MAFFRMSRPAKRKRSSFAMFRQRIPLDVVDKVRGKTLTIPLGAETFALPVTATAVELGFSLRTRDPAEASLRWSVVNTYLQNVYRAIRNHEPLQLSHEQAVALSHDLYAAWADMPLAAQMQAVAEAGEDWAGLGLDVDEKMPRTPTQRAVDGAWASWQRQVSSGEAMEAVLPLVRRSLEKRGLPLDGPSLGAVQAEFVRALSDGLAKQKRNADGDYTPDANAKRFPVWVADKKRSANGFKFVDMFELWKAQKSPSPSSISSFKTSLEELKAFVGHDDPSRVTKTDIRNWRDQLALTRTPKTVNDRYLAGVKALYSMAVKEEKLDVDPTLGVRDERKEKAGKSILAYDDEDVAKIVALADAETDPRYRWIPLLLATTGARVAEIAYLWGSNVMCTDDIHFIRITETDDGGRVKTDASERDIPLHPEVIKRGFLKFVKERGDAPLFYDKPSPRASADHRYHKAEGVATRVREWVRRKGFTDPRKAPNHSFRHWFKSVAPEFGIMEREADIIQGHVGNGGQARKYHHGRLKRLHQALSKVELPKVKR